MVTARTGNTPANFELGQRVRPFQRPIRLYLVPNRLAGDVRTRFDARLYYLGSVMPDARGRGILTFRVPPLDSDHYTVASWCPACAPYSGGTFSALRVDRNIVPRYRRLMLLRVHMPSADQTCPVTTRPRGRYGTSLLSTSLPREGVLAGRSQPNSSIFWKFGWLPAQPGGTLTVRGERIDASSPPMRVLAVNWGYSSTGRGSWASAVEFPGEGCWRVTARVRDVRLAFVVRVVRA